VHALVVGGAGFLGSHLVDRLLAEGGAVDVVDDLSTGSLANLASARAVRDRDLRIHTLDARAPELVDLAARRPPEIVYLVNLPRHRGPADRDAFDRAVGSTLNVLDVAGAAGAKVVVALRAMDLYGPVAARDLPVREHRPAGAPGSYAALAARTVTDVLAVAREQRRIEFTALACSSLYGPRRRDGVVAAFVQAATTGERAVIDGDGRQTRDLLHVDDAVDALVRAGRKGGGLVIHAGTGTQVAIRDLHRLVCGPGAEVVRRPESPDEPGRFALSPVRARIHLGWEPFTALADGIERLRDPG
jgi:UDP-glucose 4-epimerase